MSWTQRLADLAVRIAPERRRDWARAIQAELAYLPAAQRPGFALGGLMAAIGWRASDPLSVNLAARCVLAAGALLWAGLLAHLAWRLAAADAVLATAFSVLGVVAGVGAILTARLGLDVVIRAGGPCLVVATGYVVLAERLTPDFRALRYCRAVSVEIAVLLFVAISVAMLVQAYSRRETA